MSLFNTPDMPEPLKYLLWIAAALGAVGVIWTQLHLRKLLGRVLNELSRNGGDTVKDLVTRAARDSQQAAADSKEALDLAVKLDKRTKRDARRLNQAVHDVGELKDKSAQLEKRFERFVLHEAKNDLHTSKLVKEAEQKLRETEDRE